MKKLNIPFFSQLDDSVPKEHQRHVCALACIKMVLDSREEHLNFEDIYKEANIVGNQVQAGWTHETIIRILRNHKVIAYRQEFLGHTIDIKEGTASIAKHTEQFVDFGIEKIKKSIELGNPIFVSVKANFSDNKEDHVVLIIGYSNDKFIILDPIMLTHQNPREILIEEFKKFWKNFAIFTE